ncbi:GGDEF domain-containing protein [Thermosipho melanesiensis]|uniref:Diguanylate cyclase n=1 Tax=Thermosipho melanesiensis (strain DSM 12029 / CIP 104789 / BI429) TaxID=391009 RepID=A6LL82_THEM4|nr:GGDEF domain-containing protein [Thermosipho melanesiensis]ABR30683.1 diguanylate cyclase [Thermosipho melanesiensis BI429]
MSFKKYIFKKVLRKTDIISRWGGEEFLILLPQTDIEEAYKVAEKIRNFVEKEVFGDGIKVTISIGVGSIKEGVEVRDLLTKIDKKLYEAKNMGRNRVIK